MALAVHIFSQDGCSVLPIYQVRWVGGDILELYMVHVSYELSVSSPPPKSYADKTSAEICGFDFRVQVLTSWLR